MKELVTEIDKLIHLIKNNSCGGLQCPDCPLQPKNSASWCRVFSPLSLQKHISIGKKKKILYT